MRVHPAITRVVLGLTLAGLPVQALLTQGRDDGFRIVNVRLFDGERVVERTNVAVVEGLIRAVGELREWRQLRAIDGTGATLLPGFIDTHVHVRDANELRQSLRFGVTTVIDMGATVEPKLLFALRDAAGAAHDLADVRLAGFFARACSCPEPGMSVEPPPVETVDGAKRFVAMRHAEGANHLKIGLSGMRTTIGIPNLDESRTSALVETAHGLGMLAVAHVETVEDVRMALAGGIDGLAHAWRSGGAHSAIAKEIAERGVFVIAALAPPDSYQVNANAELLAEPRFSRLLSDDIKEHLRRLPERIAAAPAASRQERLESQTAAVRSLHEARARLVVGTDASYALPVAFGVSLHRELELLQRAGLSPLQTLAAATGNAADAFRLQDRGRIVPGRRADMLLVRGDPTSDILATRDILGVWKQGVEVGSTRGEVPRR